MSESFAETSLIARPQHQAFLSPLDAAWDPSLPTEDVDEYCWTPLQLAARSGDIQAVRDILASQGRSAVNDAPRGYYGQTALQAACMQGHEDVVKYLLDAGADVHFCGGNNFQRTGLQIACGQGNENVVRLLLEAGSEVNMSPAMNHGIRILTRSQQEAHSPPKTFAVARYNGRTALQAASERGHLNIVKLLLERGAEVNAPPSPVAGCTALQAAAKGGYGAIVHLLLSHGAQANAPSARYKGVTALQGACLQGNLETVELLLRSGADVQASGGGYDGDGTALHAAAEKGHLDIVKKLIGVGADINARSNRRGQTPMQGAMAGGHETVVKCLRDLGAVGKIGGGFFIFR
ncbi:ankyrin repeat-containing domain protein [Trichoderma austrokoningii]